MSKKLTSKFNEQYFRYSIYIILGIISISALFIYPSLSNQHSLLASFLKDSGIAGIIALILTATIESFNRRSHALAADRLLEKINKNLFEAVYKRFIPKKIFSEVEKCLLRSDVYRKKYVTIQHNKA